VRIRSTSPLARAQEQADINQFNQFAQNVNMVFGPQMTNLLIDGPVAAEYLRQKYDVPKTVTRSQVDMKRIVSEMGAMNATPEQVAGDGPAPAQNQPRPQPLEAGP
jgi:hypothetical protein